MTDLRYLFEYIEERKRQLTMELKVLLAVSNELEKYGGAGDGNSGQHSKGCSGVLEAPGA